MPTKTYGQPMEGQLLEEWCHNAAEDARDWYTAEERYEACTRFRAYMDRITKRDAPFKSVIIEGEPGAGKTNIANYAASLFAATFGVTPYSDSTFGYGIALTTEEMLGAYNFLEKGAIMFIDEANQYDRIGRDNSDIQEIRASHYQVVRKNQCTIINASANADRMSRGTRSRCDEFWHPQKLTVRYSEEAKRRLLRLGQGKGGRGKQNPGNFAYAVLKALDKPHRPPSIFDGALGKARDPKAGIPIYRKVLEISWMRKVSPLYNSFKKVDVAAALGADRQNVIDLALGKASASFGGVSVGYIENLTFLALAFYDGRLTMPVVPPSGGVYHPTYMTAGNIRNAAGIGMGITKFSNFLREDLGLAAIPKQGYEMGQLYETVAEAITEPSIQPKVQEIMNNVDQKGAVDVDDEGEWWEDPDDLI